jgi:hypothetical protein
MPEVTRPGNQSRNRENRPAFTSPCNTQNRERIHRVFVPYLFPGVMSVTRIPPPPYSMNPASEAGFLRDLDPNPVKNSDFRRPKIEKLCKIQNVKNNLRYFLGSNPVPDLEKWLKSFQCCTFSVIFDLSTHSGSRSGSRSKLPC